MNETDVMKTEVVRADCTRSDDAVANLLPTSLEDGHGESARRSARPLASPIICIYGLISSTRLVTSGHGKIRTLALRSDLIFARFANLHRQRRAMANGWKPCRV